MNSKDGIILWVTAGAGVVLLYSAIKNESPASVLAHYVNPSQPIVPLTGKATIDLTKPLTTTELATGKSQGYTIHDPGTDYATATPIGKAPIKGTTKGYVPELHSSSQSYIPGGF